MRFDHRIVLYKCCRLPDLKLLTVITSVSFWYHRITHCIILLDCHDVRLDTPRHLVWDLRAVGCRSAWLRQSHVEDRILNLNNRSMDFDSVKLDIDDALQWALGMRWVTYSSPGRSSWLTIAIQQCLKYYTSGERPTPASKPKTFKCSSSRKTVIFSTESSMAFERYHSSSVSHQQSTSYPCS